VSLGGVLIDGRGIAAMSRATEFLAEGGDGSAYGRDTVAGWQPLGGLVSGGIGAVALN